MEKFLRDVAIIATRTQADRTNRSCLTASLAEAAITIGTRRIVQLNKLNQSMGVGKDGNTLITKLFEHLQNGAETLDLEVTRVIANPSFLNHCDNYKNQSIIVTEATGTVTLPPPHIRILSNEYKSGVFSFHAEWDDGSKRSIKRIKQLESKGFNITAAAILLRRKIQ